MRVLSKRILNNFNVTLKTISHCSQSGIGSYRLSSEITPLLSHPDLHLDLTELDDAEEIFRIIDETKKEIKRSGLRISSHPPEFVSFTSQNEHAMLFDLYDCPKDYRSPLNIHIRQDGDPEELSQRFMSVYNRLKPSVKNRLVLEVNDNKNGTWSVKNLIKYFYERHGIPITFDSLHQSLLHGDQSDEEAFNDAYRTWPTKPLFHYSEGVDGTRKHADMPINHPKNFGQVVDFDIELKSKDLAIFKLQEFAAQA